MDLVSLGWNQRWDQLFEAFHARRLIAARVVADGREPVIVQSQHGRGAAAVAGRLDSSGEPDLPVIGDWVAVDAAETTPVIRAVSQ